MGKVLVWNSETMMWDWDAQQNAEWVVVTLIENGKEALTRYCMIRMYRQKL